ncbi:methyltransferase domain-containing protein [Altererythrobacter sp. SALINAS58]|uniref:methyltransferase domain-containing protein n=1 Tax=Alteripontixanthobacter muriae TaxID=2705546 RepID=UPI00157736A3|nr:methyltransferase domain-containing protein [Alteripontixanthobacter muriae]NTZ42975.1 methyltransferase domain-containing protein [Alteripontixanthobacter muriae]
MLAERLIAEELMDDPDLDPVTYQDVVHDLARVNRITLAYRPTLAFLERAIGSKRRFSLLDVGFGDGDMLRRISRWARKNGIEAKLVGVDLNPRSEQAARSVRHSGRPIEYLTGDYADLAGDGFDCIVSSLVAHHMSRDELIAFLRFMEAEAALGWFINDLHRHRVAYFFYPLLAGLMRWHPIVRHDGKTSIARSYRPGEWAPLLAEADVRDAQVNRYFPYRLCVEKLQ